MTISSFTVNKKLLLLNYVFREFQQDTMLQLFSYSFSTELENQNPLA